MRKVLALSVCLSVLPMIGANVVHAQEKVQADPCADLLKRLAAIDKRIADLEAEQALADEMKDMIDGLNEAIKGLEAAKGDAESYEKKLGEVQEAIGAQFEQFSDMVEKTKAGTSKFKDALGSTADGLKKARNAFKLYEASLGEESSPAETLALLSESFGTLKGALGPLISQVPLIGDFLTLYAGALESATSTAKQLESIRERNARIVDEFPQLGSNPFRFPSSKQRQLDELEDKRAKLQAELDNQDCPSPDEKPPLTPEQTRILMGIEANCIAKMNAKEHPDDAYFDALRRRDNALTGVGESLSEERGSRQQKTDAQRELKEAQEIFRKAKIQRDNASAILDAELLRIGTNSGKSWLDQVRRNAPGFPAGATSADCKFAEAILSGSKVSSGLTTAVNSFCNAVRALERAEKRLDDAKKKANDLGLGVDRSEEAREKAEKELQGAREAVDRTGKQRKAFNDCVAEQAKAAGIPTD